MSLIAFALRLIVTRALTGKTFAGSRVLNAPVEPLDDVLAEGAAALPLIAVFTGTSSHEGEGRDLLAGLRTVLLTVQIFIPPRAEVDIGGPSPLAFEARGAGAAALIDLTWRQCTAALVRDTTDPANPWPRLFAEFVPGIEKITSTPLLYEDSRQEKRLRVPAVEYDLDCRIMAEPMFGVPLANHWLRLDAAMRAEPGLTPLADLIKGMIEQPDDMPGWRQAQAALALSDDAIRASGLAPQDDTATGEAALLGGEDGDAGALTIDPADLTIVPPAGP
jgi:hypothetical protein